ALELGLALEQRLPAARAYEDPRPFLVKERAAPRPLGAVPPHDLVLLRGQDRAPLRVGMGDGKMVFLHDILLRPSYRRGQRRRQVSLRPAKPRRYTSTACVRPMKGPSGSVAFRRCGLQNHQDGSEKARPASGGGRDRRRGRVCRSGLCPCPVLLASFRTPASSREDGG